MDLEHKTNNPESPSLISSIMTLDRDGGVDPRLVKVPAGDYKGGALLYFCFFFARSDQ